jgi:hypothetical protein
LEEGIEGKDGLRAYDFGVKVYGNDEYGGGNMSD